MFLLEAESSSIVCSIRLHSPFLFKTYLDLALLLLTPTCQLRFSQSVNYISLSLSTVFLTFYQIYFSQFANSISLSLSTIFLPVCQLYFSQSVNCISPSLSTVFLSAIQLYFSFPPGAIYLVVFCFCPHSNHPLLIGHLPHRDNPCRLSS